MLTPAQNPRGAAKTICMGRTVVLSSTLSCFGEFQNRLPFMIAPSTGIATRDEASRYCQELALSHYENFSVASRLIPKNLRRHFFHVYAYCRYSDDLGDESRSPQEALDRLDSWQVELNDCFEGRPRHPIMIALAETIEKFSLRKKPFDDLISAFQQDQTVVRYETDDQLLDYCRRSANPVGRILLGLANVTSDRSMELSDAICSGLQLANFCQDMARDAAIGRIYLPKSRWQSRVIDEELITKQKPTPELCDVALKWCEDIADYFFTGWELTNQVPKWLARDIRLFIGGGLTVLDKIALAGGDVWTNRPVVTKLDKLKLFFRAMLTAQPPRRRVYKATLRSGNVTIE
jgi:squalene synthase HpnC